MRHPRYALEVASDRERLHFEAAPTECGYTIRNANAVQFGPDGTLIAVGTTSGTVLILGVPEP